MTECDREIEKLLRAFAATRTKGTYCNAKYHRVAARRGKKRALIAVGHMILKSIWHILHDNVSYNELGADYLTEKIAERRKTYLQNELKNLGYNVSLTKMEDLPQTA